MNNPDVAQLLRLQCKLALVAVVLSAVLGGARINIMVSTLLGGLTVLIPAWVYSRIAYAKRHVPPSVLMRAHFRAEAAKFILTVAMFGCVLTYYKNLSVAGLFCGYFFVVSGYWFGLLLNKQR